MTPPEMRPYDQGMGAGGTASTTAAQQIQLRHQPRYFEIRELEVMADPHQGARYLPLIHLSLKMTVRAVDTNMTPERAGGAGVDRSIASAEQDLGKAT